MSRISTYDDGAGAQEEGAELARTMIEYDGTRGQFVFDSQRRPARAAGVALETYLNTLVGERGQERTREHLEYLMEDGGTWERVRPWARHESLSLLVRACRGVEGHQDCLAAIAEKWNGWALDLVAIVQLEEGPTGTGVSAASRRKHLADQVSAAVKHKALPKDERAILEVEGRENIVDGAWAITLVGSCMKNDMEAMRRDLIALSKGMLGMDEKTCAAIMGKIVNQQMERIRQGMMAANEARFPWQARSDELDQGLSLMTSVWLSREATKEERPKASRRML